MKTEISPATIEFFARKRDRGSFPQMRAWLAKRPDSALFSGLAGSADAWLISDLLYLLERPVLVVTDTSRHAEVLVEECATFIDEESVSFFPSRDAVPYNLKSPFGPTVEARFRVLSQLLNNQPRAYITTAAALVQKLPPAKTLFNRIIRLETGRDITIADLSAWLVENGFRKETAVADLGAFAVRGGIVDIYPFMTDHPVRLEFWGDTIESIREFDVFTQKSKSRRSSVDIFPMREFCFTDAAIDAGIERLHKRAGSEMAAAADRLSHQWKTLGDHDGIEWFLHWFGPETASVLDYLPQDAVVVWDDLLPLDRRLEENAQNYLRHLERAPEQLVPLLSPPRELLHNHDVIAEELSCFARVYVDTAEAGAAQRYECRFSEQPAFPQQIEPFVHDLQEHHAGGFECIMLSPNLGSAERLAELLGESCAFLKIYIGTLLRGFLEREGRRLLYTESQLFNRPLRPTRPRKVKGGMPITGYDALSPGDFVVHVDYGIARFLGIQRVDAADIRRDCMVLLYQEKAKLFVPVEDFHKVQKYIGKEAYAPPLSRLGTAAWERLKERTRESLREMAKELIELYAKRQYLEGIAFSPDTMWQKEFEDAFVYDETPDQLTAIRDVKKDMESGRPMDRLVCGDVGFGKTEVAMRAAFKAVMDGYQAAVLTPTTILAVQHHATFTERMANFPIKIASLSRFLSAREQKEVIEKIARREIDIVIGTHRMLSKDVRFANLGLLIIDEEQKFGVRHKERLKQLKYKIDVLSLTATPIPRTLHMSLVGARDLSLINTPPRNRLPVETVVAEYHDDLVKNAVERELDRGGQVYFVHNRIKNLDVLRDRVEQLAPRARIAAAHGQMDEDELESIMNEFIAGRFDVLVSTVIIENGLDIANVNTIIVNRADAMGLSQLYQLRGRVGRSSAQAYAYLLTAEFARVDEQSLRRLRALEQYTELGSGFQIAMRDLEIRGAGNILGTRQHGFIAAVGFELYCRLLQEAVAEIKGEKPAVEKSDVRVDVPIEAVIPTEYVPDGAARISLYQELSSIDTPQGIVDMRQELADRFGPLPPAVQSLLLLMEIKTQAKRIGCSHVKVAGGMLILGFEGDAKRVQERIGGVIISSDRAFEVTYEAPILLTTKLAAGDRAAWAQETRDILERCSAS